MNFLDKSTILTDIIFTDFALKNEKTVKDIVKFTISDDDIDYNLANTDIQNLYIASPVIVDNIIYNIITNNNSLNSLNFNINVDTNGILNIDREVNLSIKNSSFITFECTNDTNISLIIYDKNFISSILIDNSIVMTTNDILKLTTNYVSFNSIIKIYFNNGNITSSKFGFISNNVTSIQDYSILLYDNEPMLITPILTDPLGNTNYFNPNAGNINILFNWKDGGFATDAQLQVSLNDDTFDNSNLVYNYPSLVNSVIGYKKPFLLNFSMSGTYYWRVQSLDKNGIYKSSNFSNASIFNILNFAFNNTTMPNPIIGYPVNTIIYSDTDVNLITFKWGGDSTTNYHIQIGLSNTFDILYYDDDCVGNSFNAQLGYGIYYWRVKAINYSNPIINSNYSIVGNFYITNNSNLIKLDTPSLIFPNNGQMFSYNGYIRYLIFNWNQVKNANDYEFQMASDQFFNNMLVDTNAGPITVFGISSEGTYYWRVKAINNTNSLANSDFSSIFNFTSKVGYVETSGILNTLSSLSSNTTDIIQVGTSSGVPITLNNVKLATPNLMNPSNNASYTIDPNLGTLAQIQFTWSSVTGTTIYHMQIAKDSAFQNLFFDSNYISGGTVVFDKTQVGTYYWRVKAINLYDGTLDSDYSNSQIFSVVT